MKTTVYLLIIFFYNSFAFADNYENVPELTGKSMTLLTDIYLDSVIDYQLSPPFEESNPFTTNEEYEFIYKGELLSETEFDEIHAWNTPFCVISVTNPNTNNPNTIAAGSISTTIDNASSVKGYNYKNGRYNTISVRSYNDINVVQEAYISSVHCTQPEKGLFRKPQMTADDLLRLTEGVVAFE